MEETMISLGIVLRTAQSWVPPLARRFLAASLVGFSMGILPRVVEAVIRMGKTSEEIPASQGEVHHLTMVVGDLHGQFEALRADLAKGR